MANLKQIEAPILGSRKFWSAVIGAVFTVATYMLTKEVGLAYFVGVPFLGNVAAIFAQNMLELKNGGK